MEQEVTVTEVTKIRLREWYNIQTKEPHINYYTAKMGEMKNVSKN